MLDINECSEDNFCNGHKCINLEPGFHCECPGFDDERCTIGNFNI